MTQFGFDLTKTYSTFVSILQTFIDIFVALTELRKKIITHIVQKKKTQNFFRMKKPHKIFFAQKSNAKFYLRVGWAFDNYQLLDAEM